MNLKKCVLIVLFCFVFVLVGCKNNEVSKPDLNFDYSFNAKISTDETTYKIEGKVVSNQWEFVIHSPAEIDGMVVKLNNDNATIYFQDLESVYQREDMPTGNVCNTLASCMDYLKNSKKINFTNTGKSVTGKGIFRGSDIIVEYDKNNFPSHIQIGESIIIDISDFIKL